MTLVSVDENKVALKKYEELCLILLDQEEITQITMKYMKIKFNSDEDLPLKKTWSLQDDNTYWHAIPEDSKYSLQVFLDYCLLSECNGAQTHTHLVSKWTLNH